MSKVKCTIIMSNYNQAQYIGRAIDSVLAQKTNFHWQLIITDDHSTKDNSVEIIKGYAKQYPNQVIPLFNQENGRYLKNILRAKELTKTEYFTLLDADDYWTDKNYLQEAVDYLDTHQDTIIYGRNVLCVEEETGRKYPFISLQTPNREFNLKDYFENQVIITQTTGSFFRNVIFSHGIPEIMTQAINTLSERSFEGDADRFIMHLKYGKAFFCNKFSGVYTIQKMGIWSRMAEWEKHLIQAQCYIDYDRYFEYTHHQFFVTNTYKELRKALEYLKNIQEYNFIPSSTNKELLFNILAFCQSNKQDIQIDLYSKHAKLKYQILMKFYLYVKDKLKKKGFLND